MAGPSTQLAAECSDRRRQDHREDRRRRIGERTDRDRDDGETCDQPFRSRGIDERAAGHLPDQRDETADGENEADIDLRPFLGGQIDRDERAETGLHIGDEEHEPVEPAQAALRRAAGRFLQRRRLGEVPLRRVVPRFVARRRIVVRGRDETPQWLH